MLSYLLRSGSLRLVESCRKMSSVSSAASLAARNRIIWIDLEMTGLDDTKDHIIEAACLVTDADLKVVAEGPNIIVHQPDHILDSMGDWCQQHHGESGLTDASRKSSIDIRQAERMLLNFLEMHTNPGECPLAGNSVGEDKRFLYRYMPNLIQHLHYRIIDVSTVKELCRRWYPEVSKNAPKKMLAHRALDDIKESLAEMKYYRANIFIKNSMSTDL